MKDFLLIFILLFAVADVSICAVNENIKIDMVGYLPSGSKYVVVTEKADNFAVKDVKTGKAVFFGQLKGPVADHDSGDDCYIGDFSGVTSPGEYNIEIMDKGSSYNFKIGSGIFTDVFYKVMRGFYLQRCGVEVSDKEGRGHGECHVKPALFHQTTGEQGTLDVSGGWHDAGDYGKYTVNSGISTATLLYMFERNRNKLQAFKLDIPADGRLPDVLAEAKYNIDWMMKMQNISGGVYHKVTPLRFPEMNKKPDEDSADQYIYEITSCATGDLAAVTALASRVYGPYDAAYAAKCLEAAERAWKFLDATGI
jgi:endoglucanase